MEAVEDAGRHQRPVTLAVRFWSLFGVWAVTLLAAGLGLERGPRVAEMAPLFPLPTGMVLTARLAKLFRGGYGLHAVIAAFHE